MLRVHVNDTVLEIDCQHRIVHVVDGPTPHGWEERCRRFEHLTLAQAHRPLRFVWKVRHGAIGSVWDASTLHGVRAAYSLS